MSVRITIRGVPDDVRNELAARAAARGQSMQEFLLGELERMASRPTIDAWLQGVRDRKEVTGTRVSAADILRERDVVPVTEDRTPEDVEDVPGGRDGR